MPPKGDPLGAADPLTRPSDAPAGVRATAAALALSQLFGTVLMTRRVLHNALVRHVTQIDLLPGDSHGFELQVY